MFYLVLKNDSLNVLFKCFIEFNVGLSLTQLKRVLAQLKKMQARTIVNRVFKTD